MNCPHCHDELRITERKNIEIDYCPKCRGVWLDRGELDKLIGSSLEQYSERSHKPYKKKSLLSELFDF